MSQEVKTITLPLPLKFGTVNCYLARTDSGFVLIDTGEAKNRSNLEQELESAGCTPDNLDVIVITHGDFDHIGNAAWLRKRFNAKIAMHEDDAGMAEHGDMFWNRNKPKLLMLIMAAIMVRLNKSDRFRPDIDIEDGQALSEYGLDAKVLYLPGHTKGSIGIMTSNGDLYCGDFFDNRSNKPVLNPLMDDPAVANESLGKLKDLKINTVYPGHGKPFPMELLINSNQ